MTRKVYKIHDNRGRSFRVTIDRDTKSVHTSQSVALKDSEDYITYLYRPILMEISYLHASVPKEKPKGNSLFFLVDTPYTNNKRHNYVIIYQYHIRTFETDDKIVHFESQIKHTRMKNAHDVYDAYYNYSKKLK